MIVIEIDGGVVNAFMVTPDGKADAYVVVDRDTEGLEDDEVFEIGGAEAYVSCLHEISRASAKLTLEVTRAAGAL